MNTTQIALLVLQIGITLAIMVLFLVWLFRAKQEKLKYKLYAVRDQLIYLVAVGKLSESSFLFQLFYHTITATIAEIHTPVDRWSFIRAMTTARTSLQEANLQRFFEEITKAPSEVQQVAADFIDTMLYIVKANSLFTKFCIRCLNLFKHGRSILKTLHNFLPQEQYENYVYFGNLYRNFHQTAL